MHSIGKDNLEYVRFVLKTNHKAFIPRHEQVCFFNLKFFTLITFNFKIIWRIKLSSSVQYKDDTMYTKMSIKKIKLTLIIYNI